MEKIPNFPCLYRHSTNGKYYGIKKISGKSKHYSLRTTDRKIAERKLAEWMRNLDKIDPTAEKTTLNQLLEKFIAGRQGKSDSTKATDASIIKRFKAEWKNGLDIRVSSIKPSQLDEWLGSNEGRLKHTSYNRYCGFLKELFGIAVADKIIIDSPFNGVKTRWKKPQKPERFVPTLEEFEKIVADIRSQKFNAEAEDSADFIEFEGLAGLGQAEAASLKWGDIDWEQNVMHILRHKTHERFQVRIYEWLKPMLKRLEEKCPSPPSPNTNVFKMKDAKKSLAAACKRLGYRKFTQRNIRAALIRRLWRGGVDKKLISMWQGHQDGGRLILSTYTEVFGANDKEYIESELAKVK